MKQYSKIVNKDISIMSTFQGFRWYLSERCLVKGVWMTTSCQHFSVLNI